MGIWEFFLFVLFTHFSFFHRMARRWLPLNVPTILMNSASLIHWKSVSFEIQTSKKKFYCWTFVGPFFYAIKIFILEHQNYSSLKFTDCRRRCGMWDSLCHSFSVTFSVIFFASRFQLNVRRSPPSWDLVVWLFYIFYSYLLSWALFL